jgi:hypothetical protein
MKRTVYFHLVWLLTAVASLQLFAQEEKGKPVVDIGSRMEMFVDDWLIDRRSDIELKLQTPVRQEIVLTTDQPHEGIASAYFSVIQDGPLIRLYYRGAAIGPDNSQKQVTCYAESRDGIHFTRPQLGLHEFQGSKSNNVILVGSDAHNFAPFLDRNPAAKLEERYKALGGGAGRLFAYSSPDGIHWKKMQDAAVLTKGNFDSLNIAFWDEVKANYCSYNRYLESGVRAIQRNESSDFTHWSSPQPNRYAMGVPREHFYTSATVPCPGAPHMLLAFPKRFLPKRSKNPEANAPGVSDAVFMSSRDGLNWDRTFLEAWVRPGLDQKNWSHRNNMPAWGIVQLQPEEFSMYISEHYEWPDNRLRRITIRRHGFASLHAGAKQGEFTTRPVVFSGKNLILNYSTSAAGSVQIELQDESGKPVPGYTLQETEAFFGDELDAVMKWKDGRDLSGLIGKPIRFHIVLRDADLFAIQTK